MSDDDKDVQVFSTASRPATPVRKSLPASPCLGLCFALIFNVHSESRDRTTSGRVEKHT